MPILVESTAARDCAYVMASQESRTCSNGSTALRGELRCHRNFDYQRLGRLPAAENTFAYRSRHCSFTAVNPRAMTIAGNDSFGASSGAKNQPARASPSFVRNLCLFRMIWGSKWRRTCARLFTREAGKRALVQERPHGRQSNQVWVNDVSAPRQAA